MFFFYFFWKQSLLWVLETRRAVLFVQEEGLFCSSVQKTMVRCYLFQEPLAVLLFRKQWFVAACFKNRSSSVLFFCSENNGSLLLVSRTAVLLFCSSVQKTMVRCCLFQEPLFLNNCLFQEPLFFSSSVQKRTIETNKQCRCQPN